MSKKLPKVIIAKLKEIADMLPHIPTNDKAGFISQTITGEKALADGMKVNEGQDIKEIKPDFQYLASSDLQVGVNHYKRLVKAWNEGQNAAVEKYVASVKAKNLELIDERVKKAATPLTPEEISKLKTEEMEAFERKHLGAGKKRHHKMSGNKNTAKKSK